MKTNDEITYEENIKLWKQAYTELLDICNKYPSFGSKYGFYEIDDFKSKAKKHLALIEWYEKYGIKIDYHTYTTDSFIRMSEYMSFQYFGNATEDKENNRGRSISWSIDDRQPFNEWLLVIGFSTGAYIFGDDYDGQKQLFQCLFKELQGYKPDYSDVVNHNLYWKLENCKPIYENFSTILRKYSDINRSEIKQRKIEKLKKELELLKG